SSSGRSEPGPVVGKLGAVGCRSVSRRLTTSKACEPAQPAAASPVDPALSQPDAQKVGKLANDAAAEQQYADDENRSLDDEHPLADGCQVILQRAHEEGAGHRPKQRAQPADQGH